MEEEISIFENVFGISICDNKKNIVLLNNENNDELKKEVYGKIKEKSLIGYNIKEYLKNGAEYKSYFDVMLAWYVLGTENSQKDRKRHV